MANSTGAAALPFSRLFPQFMRTGNHGPTTTWDPVFNKTTADADGFLDRLDRLRVDDPAAAQAVTEQLREVVGPAD